MTRTRAEAKAGAGTDATQGRHWPDTQALVALHECNERFLGLMQGHAQAAHPGDPLVCELRPLLVQLDPVSRGRAARCPVLLVDAGFGDDRRWARALEGMPQQQEYAAGPYFALDAGVELARVVLTCAAHLAYSDAGSARLLFGLGPGCVEAFAACAVTQVARLADSHWHWFRPRWQNRPRYWSELLLSAMGGSALQQARMQARGLQLMAGEARPG